MCKAGFAGDDAPRAVSERFAGTAFMMESSQLKRIPLLALRFSLPSLAVLAIKVLWSVWDKRIPMLVMKLNPSVVS
jgi:hypothetical protein